MAAIKETKIAIEAAYRDAIVVQDKLISLYGGKAAIDANYFEAWRTCDEVASPDFWRRAK